MLTYRRGKSFETDYYHLFLAPPGELITQAARRKLNEAGLFPYVTLPGSDASYGYLLEGHVMELYGDMTTEPGQAVMAMQAFLLRDTPRGPAVIMSKEYRQAVALKGLTPDAVVLGMNEAVNAILDSLLRDIHALGNGG